MQVSWYNKRGKVKKLFKRKSTEPLLSPTLHSPTFFVIIEEKAMFLLLFFTIIVTILVTAAVSTQFFQSLNKITTLSHTQQKLISRRGIGKYTDITNSTSNMVFAKVTENNWLCKNLHNIASFTIYVGGSFEE